MQFSTSYARPVLPNIIIMYWHKRRPRAAWKWGARLGGGWGSLEGPALHPPPRDAASRPPPLGGPAPLLPPLPAGSRLARPGARGRAQPGWGGSGGAGGDPHRPTGALLLPLSPLLMALFFSSGQLKFYG